MAGELKTIYNNQLIRTSTADDTFTLNCNGKIMASDVTIQATDVDSLTVTYGGNTIATGSGTVTKILYCDGRYMSSDVGVAVTMGGAPPETPTDAVIFYSLEPFQLYTNNNAKNWDGTLYYSTDYSTWNTWSGTNTLVSAQSDGYHKLYVRGVGNSYLTYGDTTSSSKYWKLVGSGINCCGNLNTLLSYSSPPTTLTHAYTFAYLFYNCAGVDFDITLPATTLTDSAYNYMFYGCTSLITAPALPATTIPQYCYAAMFYGCTSLTTAPVLPATTLNRNCYALMFYGCTSLVTIPTLRATKLQTYCYYQMFRNCILVKISTTKTGAYQTAYRIPTSGTGSNATSGMNNMFAGTGGTFTGTPTINSTYYTSNTVIS